MHKSQRADLAFVNSQIVFVVVAKLCAIFTVGNPIHLHWETVPLGLVNFKNILVFHITLEIKPKLAAVCTICCL